ncbi:hypothetical protein LOY46_17130 [Pseudomonas sichuanensis]|uniref:hypothetical protein n=1 Tax=Pseudomonas sichuanensis TaxID=2213015 RepID=UPI0021606B74|nr:hypothetical protein [Pseudomonas sichuanensis]UVK81291.1 hypothetical protein LOY46_17130 [Pseudomonas sichuanensis]
MGRLLAILGIGLTFGYLGYGWIQVEGRITSLQTMGLNEVGDFLAGVFGPIAILWLVLGFFQQGIELRQGTKALLLQGEELQNSVEQQRQLASTSLQALQLEMEQRKEQEGRYRHSLRPIFHLENMEIGMEDGRYVASCRLFNDGSQVYSLSVVFAKGGNKHHCATMRTMERGSYSDFFITWHRESPGDVITIDVEYSAHDSVQEVSRFVSVSDDRPGTLSFRHDRGFKV